MEALSTGGGRSGEPQDPRHLWESEQVWTLHTLTFLFGGNGEEKDPKFLFLKNKTLTIALRKDQTSSLGGGEE